MVARMLGLGMRDEKMSERHQELTRMIGVAPAQRVMDIITHHVTNLFGAVCLLQPVAADGSRRNFWYVLMFGNGHDLLLGQATQSNAVLKTNHGQTSLTKFARDRVRCCKVGRL